MQLWSPSSRRAWIEIGVSGRYANHHQVALLAEGVDRNNAYADGIQHLIGSPSSRRAWIEIAGKRLSAGRGEVALLAEGVDRNHAKVRFCRNTAGRPPRGGRG